jgi:serine/threonine protein kinase
MTTERPLGSSYVLQDVIGRGAMGQVWRGRDAVGHQLAFKVLRPELTEDPNVVQRFVQERSILTSIRHPNVVSVRDLVVEGDTLAIVMDLVEGGDLRGMLSGPRTLPPARVAELGAGIAAGLAAVHDAGVIHRDVKPENVLVDASSSPGRPRLTDFGIAKYVAQDGARRASTMLVGTPQYIAPELIDGNEPTSATDLYALGIMLYELACGVTPFAGGSTMAVLRNHAERLPGRPPGVPDSLWDLISWLLGKHAASRPQSASQVATLLDALVPELAGLPAAEALHEPPEPEPSVHTQLTEMAMRPVTTAPVPVDAGRPAVDRPDPTPRVAARRRRVMLIGALSGALILIGGGLAGAKLMGGSAQTQAAASTRSTHISSTTSSGPTSGDMAATTKPTSATSATVSSPRDMPAKPSAPVAYQHLRNARFGFSCDVPANFVARQVPEDGDGFAYRSPDGQAQIACSAQNNVAFSGNTSLGGTSAQMAYTQELAAHRSQGDSVTYDALFGNEITLSGFTRDSNQIYYERILWGAGSVDTMSWSYPRSLLGRLNAAVEHSAAMFSPGDLTSGH